MSQLYHEQARVVSNEHAGGPVYLMTLEAPQIASHAQPGQFIHLKIPKLEAHILRRPFGVYDVNFDAGTLEVMYQVMGEGTSYLTTVEPGEVCSLIGPIGRGWQVPADAQSVLIVAGGVGSAPLLLLARQLKEQGIPTQVILGAQTKDTLVAYERYADVLGAEPLCSTDDGSFGRAGFCTSLVEEALWNADGTPTGAFDYIACCGPEPLMKIVASMAQKASVPCEVSLEKRMACGVGACLSCVVETQEGKKRACVDGPVFPSQTVVW